MYTGHTNMPCTPRWVNNNEQFIYNWTNSETNTFHLTVELQHPLPDKKGLKGILPSFSPGNPNWFWDYTPDAYLKCLSLPNRDSDKWGIDHGHPGHPAPIPTSYFGGVGLGYSDEGKSILDYNESEGRITYKEYVGTVVFNDEKLALSLKTTRYDLLSFLRKEVGGGVWIKFTEDRDGPLPKLPKWAKSVSKERNSRTGTYQNRITVKSTFLPKINWIIDTLKNIRTTNLEHFPKHLENLKLLDTFQ